MITHSTRKTTNVGKAPPGRVDEATLRINEAEKNIANGKQKIQFQQGQRILEGGKK